MKIRGRLTAVALAAILLLDAAPALGHSPIPTGTKRTFAGSVVYYKVTGSPGAWLTGAVASGLSSYFHDSHNNTTIPTIAYSATGTATVKYENSSTSPCSGKPNWIQCAENANANGNWIIHIRDLSGANGPNGWTWWEEGSTCGGSSTCWYIRRAIIHEAGHAMFAFTDMCTFDANGNPIQPCLPETYTVMNSHDPEVGTTGATPFSYRQCDEAAAQLVWSANAFGEFPDCFDHVSGHGVNGLITTLSTSVSDPAPCNGDSSTISGSLAIKYVLSYGALKGHAIAGRTVTLQRAIHGGTLANFASTTTSGSGSYAFTVSGTGSYDYRVVFGASGAIDAGLDAVNGSTVTIQWMPPPC